MKRTDPYTGPFPRGRHSHRCLTCDDGRGVACYKKQCTRPQVAADCDWCQPKKYLALAKSGAFTNGAK